MNNLGDEQYGENINRPKSEILVAILPFKTYTLNEELKMLIHGFTEDLIIDFSKFLGLSVISQYSTQHITNTTDKAVIGKLGVDYLITGSFRTRNADIRISVQLVRTEDHKVVFARQYEKDRLSLLQTQDDIIQQIVSVLQQQIDYDLLSYSYKKNTVQLAAYENWLIGMNLLKKGSPENDLKARKYFEAALKIDPAYARAYTGISLSYFNEWSCQLWEGWEVSKNGAHEYALKALELDENDYLSLAVIGRTYLFAGEWEMAEHCVRKSLRMNPNDADNLILIAFSMMYLGYPDEAVKLYQKAVRLNPYHKAIYFAYGSNFHFENGEYAKSVELGKKVDCNQCWVDFSAYMAAAYYHLSDFEQMETHWALYLKLFKAHIFKEGNDLNKEAIKWQKEINPYKDSTSLAPFWEHILGANSGSSTKPATNKNKPISLSASFLQKGEMWELIYQNKKVILKGAKGYHDIVSLLSAPEKEIHCAELMGTTLPNEQSTPLLDKKAKTQYQNRIRELQSEIAEAEAMNNSALVSSLREEYDSLLDHLSRSLGLAGKPREVGSSVEKARSAVTWRIRTAIKKINEVHPAFAKHLSNSIQTGTFCSYRPEVAIDWIL